jgi:hypothetical protein
VNNSSSGNAEYGLFAGTLNVNNVATTNILSGFWVSTGATLIGNAARNNGEYGIVTSAAVGYGQNVLTGNTLGTISEATAVEIGTNLCDTNTTCP